MALLIQFHPIVLAHGNRLTDTKPTDHAAVNGEYMGSSIDDDAAGADAGSQASLQALNPSGPTPTDWSKAWSTLLWSFFSATAYTLLATLLPAIKSFPVFTWLGWPAATAWGWEVAPSMGYVGQGMIMGPKTAVSMLAGAVAGEMGSSRGGVGSSNGIHKRLLHTYPTHKSQSPALAGYGILGPVARARGWAPGPITDWQTGAAGWVLWVSLAIMLGDSVTSLSWLMVTSLHKQWQHAR